MRKSKGANKCPYCHGQALVKAGLNPSGSQRYQCKACRRITTPQPKTNGYADEKHTEALRLYLEGNGLRCIGRLLGLTHQTVANWIDQSQAGFDAPLPHLLGPTIIELDQLYTWQHDIQPWSLNRRH